MELTFTDCSVLGREEKPRESAGRTTRVYTAFLAKAALLYQSQVKEYKIISSYFSEMNNCKTFHTWSKKDHPGTFALIWKLRKTSK